MRAGHPSRVLVVWCPEWPEETGDGETPGDSAEARAFAQVVAVVEEFCPLVEVVRPGLCVLGARGPARYFGGEDVLARKIAEAVAGQGFACRAGVADGLFAATLAARSAGATSAAADGAAEGNDQVESTFPQYLPKSGPDLITNARLRGQSDPWGERCGAGRGERPGSAGAETRAAAGAGAGGAETETGAGAAAGAGGAAAAGWAVVPPGQTRQFLAPFSVHALGRPELAGQLARLGIRTLGDFAALPGRDVTSRFGAEGTAAQRTARGLETRPLAAGPPSADLSAVGEFDPPAELAEQVVFVAKGLAEQMLAGLAARGLTCQRVRVEVVREDGTETGRLWRHEGLLSALAVAQRVRWQLDGWAPARAGGDGPVDPAGGPANPAGLAEDPADGSAQAGGITILRLVPDQLVPDEGRQLGLWGDELVSDRVERAAVRLQAMLGHEAVTHPVLAGGRGPAEQVVLVPFGDMRVPDLPADRPWPGRIPLPAPATVYPVPVPAQVTDAAGMPVTVDGRAAVSASPAALTGVPATAGPAGTGPAGTALAGTALEVIAWAGPWPVTERWWDRHHASRRARFQLVTGDGSAWLAAIDRGRWQIEARYG